jgi:hypothetical protein
MRSSALLGRASGLRLHAATLLKQLSLVVVIAV